MGAERRPSRTSGEVWFPLLSAQITSCGGCCSQFDPLWRQMHAIQDVAAYDGGLRWWEVWWHQVATPRRSPLRVLLPVVSGGRVSPPAAPRRCGRISVLGATSEWLSGRCRRLDCGSVRPQPPLHRRRCSRGTELVAMVTWRPGSDYGQHRGDLT